MLLSVCCGCVEGKIIACSLDDEMVKDMKCRAAGDDMAEKMRAFRALSQKLREQTQDVPQTPSQVLIREDRDSGHRGG